MIKWFSGGTQEFLLAAKNCRHSSRTHIFALRILRKGVVTLFLLAFVHLNDCNNRLG